MKPQLNQSQVDPQALAFMSSFHQTTVKEVQEAVQKNKYVVIGMGGNPYVKKAKALLQENGVQFQYLEYGNYLSKWHERLAIKLWSGWPTFPQVFIDGKLIGGFDQLKNINPKT